LQYKYNIHIVSNQLSIISNKEYIPNKEIYKQI